MEELKQAGSCLYRVVGGVDTADVAWLLYCGAPVLLGAGPLLGLYGLVLASFCVFFAARRGLPAFERLYLSGLVLGGLGFAVGAPWLMVFAPAVAGAAAGRRGLRNFARVQLYTLIVYLAVEVAVSV